MGKKVISTSDGKKLVDTKTMQLAGSLPKKAREPKANPVATPKKVVGEVKLNHDRVPGVDSAYQKFQTTNAVAEETRYGIPVKDLENAKIKTEVVAGLVQSLYDDPFAQGYSQFHWRNIISRAYDRFFNVYGLPTEKNQGIQTIQEYVMDMYDKDENNKPVDKQEAEIMNEVLFALEGFGVKREEINPHFSPSKIEEVLSMLEEAKSNYSSSSHYPGSSDYDPSPCEGLASDAFEMLGFSSAEAYKRGSKIFENLTWEPF